MPRTMQQIVANALEMTRSDSLTKVLTAFQADSKTLREILYTIEIPQLGYTAQQFHRHPVCVLYSAAVCRLTGSETGMRFERALQWCNLAVQSDSDPPLPVDAN